MRYHERRLGVNGGHRLALAQWTSAERMPSGRVRVRFRSIAQARRAGPNQRSKHELHRGRSQDRAMGTPAGGLGHRKPRRQISQARGLGERHRLAHLPAAGRLRQGDMRAVRVPVPEHSARRGNPDPPLPNRRRRGAAPPKPESSRYGVRDAASPVVDARTPHRGRTRPSALCGLRTPATTPPQLPEKCTTCWGSMPAGPRS